MVNHVQIEFIRNSCRMSACILQMIMKSCIDSYAELHDHELKYINAVHQQRI